MVLCAEHCADLAELHLMQAPFLEQLRRCLVRQVQELDLPEQKLDLDPACLSIKKLLLFLLSFLAEFVAWLLGCLAALLKWLYWLLSCLAALLLCCSLGYLATWLLGYLAAWLLGYFAALLLGCFATWLLGCFASLLLCCLAARLLGCVTAWLLGCLATWLLGCWAALLLCCLAALLLGCLAAWLLCCWVADLGSIDEVHPGHIVRAPLLVVVLHKLNPLADTFGLVLNGGDALGSAPGECKTI